ncbi:MAG: response regulator transcription factor [Chloroflexota bacterium]|nr:response regulator transcription factor [Chloroflexota bacterium]
MRIANTGGPANEPARLKVLIADDDADLLDILAYSLQREGFEVVSALDGRQALARVATEQPDLAVLDVNMPEVDGFEVCRRLREESSIPIIMLTSRGDDEDIVTGLDLGADDYMTKPYSPRELVSRVRALARRSHSSVSRRDHLVAGPFQIDPDHMEVRRNGEPIRLTRLQFELLRFMVANQGQVLPTETLMENVWGYNAAADATLVKTHIYHLRQRIEEDPSHPKYVVTVPGVGYLFQPR